MRVLIDISHPAHVHFFKNAIREFQRRGHEVRVVSRVKDITVELLDALGLAHQPLSAAPARKNVVSFAGEALVHCWRLLRIARAFRPDVMLQCAGTFIAPVGWLLGRPAVAFYDTEIDTWSNAVSYPLLTAVCTPECYEGSAGPRQVRYPGYHALAYLHPDVFTPDRGILEALGGAPDETISLVRFVGWGAVHDYRHGGFTPAGKRELVAALGRFGRVLITSEGPLPDDLARHRSPIPVHRIHDLMAFATLVVGESATMASEAAMLGVPALFLSSSGRGYTTELERRYDLIRTFTPAREAECIEAARTILSRPRDALRAEYREKRARMLAERISTTTWLTAYVESRFG